MKITSLLGLCLILGAHPQTAHAAASLTFDPDIPLGYGGAVGLELNKQSADPSPACYVWTLDGQFCWSTGMDVTRDYPGTPDLVLAYSRDTNADNLRIRADDARMTLGPKIGHPVAPFQLDLEPNGANGGLCVGTNGMISAYFYNRGPTHRTMLDLDNLWSWGTDLNQNGGTDLWLYNHTLNAILLRCGSDQSIGFYGADPVTRPVVTGSWSDGSAAKSLLAALVRLGLVSDRTNP